MFRRLVSVVLLIAVVLTAAASALAQTEKLPPLSRADLIKLVELKIADSAIIDRLQAGGIAFGADAALLEGLKKAGASKTLLSAVHHAKVHHQPHAAGGEATKIGTTVGQVKSKKDAPGGRNVIIDILAPGEEKARSYHVLYDPKIKGAVPSILAAVRAVHVGDRVLVEWVATGHGPAIRSIEVLKKKVGTDK